MRISIGLIIVILGFLIVPPVMADGVTVQASNKFEYHLDRQVDSLGVHSDSLRNRLVVDLLYEHFYAGIWYEAFHPLGTTTSPIPPYSTYDSSFSGITQRYFGWSDGKANIRVGNFYANFNRGLILRAYENEDIQVDKNIDGVWGNYLAEKYNFEAFKGKLLLPIPIYGVLSPLFRTRDNNGLMGFRGELTPLRQIRIGGAAVRYERYDPLIDTTFVTNAQEMITGFSYGAFDLYANFARQQGTLGYPLGRFDLDEGNGTYLSASISTSKIGLAAEYKNFYNMGLDINAPPVSNHRNRSPNALGSINGANDRGFQISAIITPNKSWTFEADVGQSGERPDSLGHNRQRIFNNFYEARGYIGQHIVVLNYERVDLGIEGLEHLPHGELTIYLNQENTLTLTGQVKKSEKMRIIYDKPDYHETDYSGSFSHSYYFTVTVFGGFTSQKFNEYEQSFPERSGAVSLSLRYGQHDLNIFFGDQRGGFVCTEGACRLVPPFRGLKTTLISRF